VTADVRRVDGWCGAGRRLVRRCGTGWGQARWWRLADRYGVAVGYPLGLALGTLLLRAQPPDTQAAWLAWASTNLANATDHPLAALLVSAFVTEGDLLGWLALAAAGLGVLGARLRAGRTLLLVGAAHVLGTLVSQGILAYRIDAGAALDSDRYISDVGPSYVVVAALVAGVWYGSWPGRVLCTVGFAILASTLFDGLPVLSVPAVGHVTAIAVALAPALLSRMARRMSDDH
jgi:hypothetical protein